MIIVSASRASKLASLPAAHAEDAFFKSTAKSNRSAMDPQSLHDCLKKEVTETMIKAHRNTLFQRTET
ncbi:MAG: hypothetical protein H7838_08135 [Magnetococcus sp. DMHC-8]